MEVTFKEDPMTANPQDDPIATDSQDLQKVLLCKKALALSWLHVIEWVMWINFYTRIMVLENLVFMLWLNFIMNIIEF